MKIDRDNNHDKVVEGYETKLKAKDKRRRPKMKVSGSSVKRLQRELSRRRSPNNKQA